MTGPSPNGPVQSISRRISTRSRLLQDIWQRVKTKGPPDDSPERVEQSPQEDEAIRIDRRLPVCFAVDVSGSTEGAVLQAEQDAITKISSALSESTQYSMAKSSILPWDNDSHVQLPLNDVNDLTSGGGTEPVALLRDFQYRSLLQHAKLWFLMTDGQIDQFGVKAFANKLSEAGVHGISCVIITYGYRDWSPYQCDVSVGISVFAVAPNCLFLYHSVHEDKLYVLQAKGCFKQLLPKEKGFISFNSSTRWDDLHRISYEDLANVKVPKPTVLSKNSVVLPNGKIFKMQDIYDNRVSDDDKLELLSDPASLDVILLAANTRGTGNLIESWLEKTRQKHRFAASEALDREDIGGLGLLQLTRLIVQATEHTDSDTFWDTLRNICAAQDPAIEELKLTLRHRHQLNWTNFNLNINARNQLLSKMRKGVDGVLNTMSRMENGMSAPSPALLTPMSSLTPSKMNRATPSRRPPGHKKQQDWSSLSCVVGSSSMDPLSPLANRISPGMGSYDDPSPAVDTSNFTFLAEFKTRDISEMAVFELDHPPAYDTCLLCGRNASIQTLLLQSHATMESAHSLPGPNSLSGHKYPFVLGNYPETDVAVPFVTCDGCAFLFQQAKQLPNGGTSVIASLPLVPLQIIENRSKWVQILSSVYEHRFSENIILLVFLSTLCSTLEDLSECDDEGVESVQGWFEWACMEILSLPGLSTLVGLTLRESSLSDAVTPSMPIKDMLLMIVSAKGSKSTTIEIPLLAYPIHGFVVLLKLTQLVKEIEGPQIERLVWKKLCYHLIEQHAELQKKVGVDEANKTLDGFLFDSSALHSITFPDSTRRARSACPADRLLHTHLFDQDALDQFRRMDTFFKPMESDRSSFHYALAVVLHLLNNIVNNESEILDPGFFYGRLRYRADKLTWDGVSHDVLQNPVLVTEAMAAELIHCICMPENI